MNHLTDSKELLYGSSIQDFLTGIFEEEFSDKLIDEILIALKLFSKINLQDKALNNINIDFRKIPAKNLYQLLNSKDIEEISSIFFNNSIPYSEILDYCQSQRKVGYNKMLIEMLKEKTNG